MSRLCQGKDTEDDEGMDTKGEDTKDDEEGGDKGRVRPVLITVCKVLARVTGKERWSTTWFHFPHS